MARRGDGIYLRKNTWWLDAVIHGRRYQISLGKNIKRSDAAEIAMVKRAGILEGELGIGRKMADISFGDAAGIFLDWARMHKSVRTHSDYEACIGKLRNYFDGVIKSRSWERRRLACKSAKIRVQKQKGRGSPRMPSSHSGRTLIVEAAFSKTHEMREIVLNSIAERHLGSRVRFKKGSIITNFGIA